MFNVTKPKGEKDVKKDRGSSFSNKYPFCD